MKPGDLVRLKKTVPHLSIFEGDLAILTKVDWDSRDYPDGIKSGDLHITGRGFFFFPDRHAAHEKFKHKEAVGIILLYNDFEVVSEAG